MKDEKDIFSFVIHDPDWRSPWSIVEFLVKMAGFMAGIVFLVWLLINPYRLLAFMILLGLFRFVPWTWSEIKVWRGR
jgi:hypothetical protein